MSEITGMYEVLDAIEACIKACDPDKRKQLAETLDAYSEDFPDDFFWAVGPQAPALLHHLLQTVDVACREEGSTKRAVLRLIDRKPEGNA